MKRATEKCKKDSITTKYPLYYAEIYETLNCKRLRAKLHFDPLSRPLPACSHGGH